MKKCYEIKIIYIEREKKAKNDSAAYANHFITGTYVKDSTRSEHTCIIVKKDTSRIYQYHQNFQMYYYTDSHSIQPNDINCSSLLCVLFLFSSSHYKFHIVSLIK